MRVVALALLAVLFGQLLGAATSLSATVDEGFHITSGYEYLRTGRLRLFDEHPPLAKALFAWPLFLVPDLTPPERAPGYGTGDLIAAAQQTTLAYRPLARVIVAPRVAASLFTLLVAASIYPCAKVSVGKTAGLLALLFCVFDPNFVAHGGLATTDMGAAALSFWAVWAGSRWIERPSPRRWWLAALLLGMAQAAKLTALLIYPVLGLAVLVAFSRNRATGNRYRKTGQLLVGYIGIVVISVLVLWALYGFEVRPSAAFLEGSISLPATSHIERWIRLRENLAYGRESFLLGQTGMHGWASYFPVALLVKSPLPLLILGVWACAAVVRPRALRRGRRPRVPAAMVLFPLFYAVASLMSTLNIGYRHLLPVLPFAYVGIAGGIGQALASRPWRGGLRARLAAAGLALLLLWLVTGMARVAPHYLSYFNEIAGGPDSGWQFLADSNTDWGQTFGALADYQSESGLGTVKMSAFTFYDPAAYGVDYDPIAPMTGAPTVLRRRFNPEAGAYAISATTLDGVPLAYPATFDWFRHRKPFAQIGHVMLLYDVSPLQGTWLAQCSTPVAPLTAEAAAEGFGVDGLRSVTFDCEQSWVLPGDASGTGWYARAIEEQTRLRWPREDLVRADLLPAWVASWSPVGLVVNYVQGRSGALPAFALWACDACEALAPKATADLQGLLVFQGFVAPASADNGTTIDVLTTWRILATPERPVSLMLHLRGVDGVPIAIGDGLGYPIEQWRAGDWLVQRHRLAIPAGVAGDLTLHTGAYWLDTLVPLRGETPTVALVIE